MICQESVSTTQHCCQTPSVPVIGRQCHIQPSGSLAAPMLEVSSLKVCVPSPEPDDLPTRFVEVFVASFSKVPMMSEAKHTQSSWESRYSLCVAHSLHACAAQDEAQRAERHLCCNTFWLTVNIDKGFGSE